jgi:hypothetical protein
MEPGETIVLITEGLPTLFDAGGDARAGLLALEEALGGQPTGVGAVAGRLRARLEERHGATTPPPKSCAICVGLR